jgi:RNA polymerase sigma factor (sigma-70 family)
MSQHDSFVQYSLVERARQGDKEAFGELVRQHRIQMLKWANQVVRNPVKAEDIVQDALVQTLRRISSLTDTDKFLPWLRTLVRNQALMSVRGASHTREILIAKHSFAGNEDPQLAAFGHHALEELQNLLGRLGERERAVMEAYSIAGLSIEEVMMKLNMKSGAVYTAISRSRAKLIDAQYEDEIERYVVARRKKGRPLNLYLDKARYYGFAGSHNTMTAMMLVTIAATGIQNVSLTDIMGATGHAFRIQVTQDLGISSPFTYNWTEIAKNGWRNLGFSAAAFGGAGSELERPDDLLLAMDPIFNCLEKGVPVVAWNLCNTEFGLITGFDDNDQTWSVMDTSASRKKLPYSKLGRLRADSEWFVIIPRGRIQSYQVDPLSEVFLHAARHIRGESTLEVSYSLCGRYAYQTWIDSLSHRRLTDPLTAAYNSAITAEARTHAARYLQNILSTGKLNVLCPSVIPAVTHAQRLYQRIAEAWAQVSKLFPLPFGADPTSPGPSGRAIRLLERAAAVELEVADVLEEASYWLEHKSVPNHYDARKNK